MNTLMVDMEFLDLKPTAAIMQIGAVVMDFEQQTLGEQFFVKLSVLDCVMNGMTIGRNTYTWWMAQDRHVLEQHLTAAMCADYRNLFDALGTFHQFCEAQSIYEYWSCGAMDHLILDHAFSMAQMVAPWWYRQWRDYRTMREEFGHLVTPPEPILPSHNALNDALWQAKHLLNIKAVTRTLGNTTTS